VSGPLYVGTSGFSYPDWAPAFYPPGTRADGLLPSYAARLPACELNNTYYRQPTPKRIGDWVAATPPGFRFTVKAQRGGSLRALLADPAGTLPWLIEPLRGFGDRLGSVLFRVPGDVGRDVGRLRALLDAWPVGVPVTFEFQDPSWVEDDVFELLRSAAAAVCATDLEANREPPRIDLTGRFLYLRLRREAYATSDREAWAARIGPFLEARPAAFTFFRHDAEGLSALRALELMSLVEGVAG